MDAIYSTTALQTKQREVKDAAQLGIVRITENGNGAFVFMSEELFEKALQDAREEAAYEARIETVLSRARTDFDEGRYYSSTEELRKAVAKERAHCA